MLKHISSHAFLNFAPTNKPPVFVDATTQGDLLSDLMVCTSQYKSFFCFFCAHEKIRWGIFILFFSAHVPLEQKEGAEIACLCADGLSKRYSSQFALHVCNFTPCKRR